MIRRFTAALSLFAAPALAQPAAPPKLIVVISVDQFSADLFAEYRGQWSGGMKRLASGVVFPSGYQSHAATETCPGHSTILTGTRPARNGIIANVWIDQTTRPGSQVYCAEDERVPGTTYRNYAPSAAHLLVPTLGDRMKAANPATRVFAVAGKDRAALMMGGANTDGVWFLDPAAKKSFVTVRERAAASPPAPVTRLNAMLAREIARDAKPMKLPPQCTARSRTVSLTGGTSVGDGRLARKAGDADSFRATPALDASTLKLAGDLIADNELGRRDATDLIAIGVSATDYVGHKYGTEGSEICIQLTALDGLLDGFFKRLDRSGVDYAVVLTADHGGHDVPERNRDHALPDAQRVPADFTFTRLAKQLQDELGLNKPVLRAAELGDVWFDRGLTAAERARALPRAVALLKAQPQVAAVFTAEELAATPIGTRPVELWTLAERTRASFHPGRSGDLVVILKPRVTPIATPAPGYAATHGSPYDYDRRVPILFWRRGMGGFEQPNTVETVDIAPTLAALIGLSVSPDQFDGRCLDLNAGAGSTCR